MVGMTMTSNASVSDYRSRYIVIDVAGMSNQSISRVSNYQLKVPFSQMSAAIRNISCQGGKVVKVTVQEPPAFNVENARPSTKPTVSKSFESNKETKSVASKKKAPRKKTTISRESRRKNSRSKKK